MNRTKQHLIALLLATVCSAPGAALAQGTYPTKPIHMVVPFAPGGATDIVGRVMAAEMTKTLGQTVLVENRPGNAGATGADIVAKSAPDGYTLCLCTVGPLITVPLLNPSLGYDPLRDLLPVSVVNTVELAIFARETLPATTPSQLVAYAKANPGKISYATPGTGGPNHFAGELLQIMAGIKLLHVPFKGDGQAIIALAGGQVDLYLGGIASALPQVKAGKVKPIMVTGASRSKLLPDIPTVSESGYAGYEASVFSGITVAAGTTPAIVERLYNAIAAAVKVKSVQETFDAQGLIPVGGRPEAFTALLKTEMEKWARVQKQTGIKLD